MRIVLLFPMKEEATPFLLSQGFEVDERSYYPHLKVGKSTVSTYLTGVGKVRAAAITQKAIDTENPDLIILAGSCCGLSDMKITTTYSPLETRQVDFQFDEPTKVSQYVEVLNAIKRHNDTLHENTTPVVCLTGDTFLEGVENKLALATEYNAKTYDMETAAVAQVCRSNGVSFICVRSVSDNIDGDMNAFERNLPFVAETLSSIVKDILAYIG